MHSELIISIVKARFMSIPKGAIMDLACFMAEIIGCSHSRGIGETRNSEKDSSNYSYEMKKETEHEGKDAKRKRMECVADGC